MWFCHGMETREQRLKRWGDAARAEREQIGQSVTRLAARARIDQGQLSRFEAGKGGIGADKRIQLAVALGRRHDDLFSAEPKER